MQTRCLHTHNERLGKSSSRSKFLLFLCSLLCSLDLEQLCLQCLAKPACLVCKLLFCPTCHLPLLLPMHHVLVKAPVVPQHRSSAEPVTQSSRKRGNPATWTSELLTHKSTNSSELIPVSHHLPLAVSFWALTELQNVLWFMGKS